jgi:hypothetical protein
MFPDRVKSSRVSVGAAAFAGLFLISVMAVASGPFTANRASGRNSALVAQAPTPTPSYIPWYTAVPSPIPGAYAAIGQAFGAGNLYNSGGANPGTAILQDTNGSCLFICYGAPGTASHHMLAYGNDYQTPGPMVTGSWTTQGAPDDCASSCPGNVPNQIYSITLQSSPFVNNGYIVALDGKGNFGVYNNVVAGAAVIAGAGDSTPEPSPSAGSLVSYTGTNSSGGGEGDILLGKSTDYAKCDYGETQSGILSCNQQLAVTKGVQPNGSSGGFAPETFPLGVAEQNPQILSATCVASFGTSQTCTFPNSFAFADATYTCNVTALGSTPTAVSYTRTSKTQITIYFTTAATFTYTCIR